MPRALLIYVSDQSSEHKLLFCLKTDFVCYHFETLLGDTFKQITFK